MKPYYQDEWVTQYSSDALSVLAGLESDSIDLLCTDPPYGISFMGKEWDRALPDINIWRECLRVLKPGSLAFVMSIPRSDCLSRMIISLEDAGFRVDFTPIYWTYASGFPKAQNIGKAVDKRLGAEREVIGKHPDPRHKYPNTDITGGNYMSSTPGVRESGIITAPATPQAKALDGSYGGFQPKPAVEVIIVAMKPMSEKTFVDQALKNGKGITWLDDCRVPYESRGDFENAKGGDTGSFKCNIFSANGKRQSEKISPKGRFPANLLVSDDVLNDGRDRKSGKLSPNHTEKHSHWSEKNEWHPEKDYGGDSGSFSRYFDLDKWAQKTFPFLIVPKASKGEKNKGLGEYEGKKQTIGGGGTGKNDPELARVATAYGSIKAKAVNSHPTVKPLKLMLYLVTLGSRAGDVVVDPFAGSGTTMLASKLLNRKCIGIEIEEKYCEIAAKRCSQEVFDLSQC